MKGGSYTRKDKKLVREQFTREEGNEVQGNPDAEATASSTDPKPEADRSALASSKAGSEKPAGKATRST